MAPPKKVPVALTLGIRTKLESLATAAGLDLEAYVVAVLGGHVIGTTPAAGNRGGRPVSVVPDDLPADIERANNATGFVGVARVGRHYTARVGRQLIGRFSSVELAASVRYYALRGFRLGRGAMFAANGLSVEEAVEMAARAGFSFEAPAPEVLFDALTAPSCTVCKDTGKMPIPSYVDRSKKTVVSYARWWPCECPAGADIDKPTDWDVTGAPVRSE